MLRKTEEKRGEDRGKLMLTGRSAGREATGRARKEMRVACPPTADSGGTGSLPV
jgi:hypothetical protein